MLKLSAHLMYRKMNSKISITGTPLQQRGSITAHLNPHYYYELTAPPPQTERK